MAEIIECCDCKMKEGEEHYGGCMFAVCPRCGYLPMVLCRPGEVPDWWEIPPPPADPRQSLFCVRLPSRCGKCGAYAPSEPGPLGAFTWRE
jgi:hypothetical protein